MRISSFASYRFLICENILESTQGLIGRENLLDEFDGLVLPHCNWIHTFFMKRTIDVSFVNMAGIIIKQCDLVPYRFSPLVIGSFFVVESIGLLKKDQALDLSKNIV